MLTMIYFASLGVTALSVLVCVAYVTLLERKGLGLVQLRLGPNKVGLVGLLQPIADAIKLLSKNDSKLDYILLFEYNMMPVGMIVIMLMSWFLYPLVSGYSVFEKGLLLILCLVGVEIYPIAIGSWYSSSVYAMMGSIRSVAQMISYEVSFIMIVMMVIYLADSLGVWGLRIGGLFFFPVVMGLLFFSLVVELNRTPADLIEGESELVSGFNTEYYGFKFAMIFLGEYGMIMFLSGVMTSILVGLVPFSVVWNVVSFGLVFLIIVFRATFPRVRYDRLMWIFWVSILGASISLLGLVLGGVFIMGVFL